MHPFCSLSPNLSVPWEVIWRVPCKIYPDFYRVPPKIFFRVASTQIFFMLAPWKKLGVILINQKKMRVDFKRYPSNHFSGCRLNMREFARSSFCENKVFSPNLTKLPPADISWRTLFFIKWKTRFQKWMDFKDRKSLLLRDMRFPPWL